jgi:hypothetical protein
VDGDPDSEIVQFVGFESTLPWTAFERVWRPQMIARRREGLGHFVLAEAEVEVGAGEAAPRFTYVGRGTWPAASFRLAARSEASAAIERHGVRAISAGGFRIVASDRIDRAVAYRGLGKLIALGTGVDEAGLRAIASQFDQRLGWAAYLLAEPAPGVTIDAAFELYVDSAAARRLQARLAAALPTAMPVGRYREIEAVG